MAGSEAMAMPPNSSEDPAGEAAHGSANGGNEERKHSFARASRAN